MVNKTLLAAVLFAAFAGAQAQTLNASNDYVIEDSGGYTYSDTTNFFNFGLVSTFYSFGVMDFSASSLGTVASVNSATLTMQESDYSSTKPVALTFWAVTDNTTNLHKGTNTTIGFDDTVAGGYSGQLGTATMLGTFNFTSTSTGNSMGVTNQNDVINFTSGLSALAGLINSSAQDIRILITTPLYPGDTGGTGYATFAGAGSSSTGTLTKFDPQLALQVTPAPEPASMALLGLGVAGIMARKHRK